jgi:16S rRNA (guanine527-N7)-methyltransferase
MPKRLDAGARPNTQTVGHQAPAVAGSDALATPHAAALPANARLTPSVPATAGDWIHQGAGTPAPSATATATAVAPSASDTSADKLKAGLEALGLEYTPEQLHTLLSYVDHLQRWNRAYNLTAIRRVEDMISHHLLDCLAVIDPLRRVAPHASRMMDVGSGGGLPGVVLALMNPQLEVTCVDAVGKKAAFVQQLAGTLSLPGLRGVHARVEDLESSRFDVVIARAFSSLADLVKLTRPLLAEGGCWAAMKGRDPTDERAQLPQDIDVFHVEQLQVPGLDAQRCLVWMRLR